MDCAVTSLEQEAAVADIVVGASSPDGERTAAAEVLGEFVEVDDNIAPSVVVVDAQDPSRAALSERTTVLAWNREARISATTTALESPGGEEDDDSFGSDFTMIASLRDFWLFGFVAQRSLLG